MLTSVFIERSEFGRKVCDFALITSIFSFKKENKKAESRNEKNFNHNICCF